MSIIRPEIMDQWEKELFSSICASVDLQKIQELLSKNYSLKILEEPEFTEGEMLVYHDQIAYKLDYRTPVSFCLLIDKSGNFKGFTSTDSAFSSDEAIKDLDNNIVDLETIKIKETEFLSTIAANISAESISDLFYRLYKLKVSGEISYKHGDAIVFNGHVAYRLAFEVEVDFSLHIDRKGNSIITLQKKDMESSLESMKSDEKKNAQPDSDMLDNFIETSNFF
ncbi:MAG: hypothetical protein HKO68_19680 [Desulfobacterales bacterium]|nr:hypothetical protein [Desulfobacterales bacterium]